ncbi:hypothetical protein FKM82_013096 [Ascaphus truei]
MLHRALITLSLALVLPVMLLTSAAVAPPVKPVPTTAALAKTEAKPLNANDNIEASFGGDHGHGGPFGGPFGGPWGGCGRNQMFYRRCRPCPVSCGDVQVECNPRRCRPGCGCIEGYVQEHPDSNRCIPQRDCAQCTKYEGFVACYRPCEEPGCGDISRQSCAEKCRPGCQCNPDLVRYEGKCIKPEWCDN